MVPTHSQIRLETPLKVWPSENFNNIVKQEIEHLDANLLPLQQGMSQGSSVADEGFKVMIIDVAEKPNAIHVKAGIFYNSVIAGCNCADDPTPVDTLQEYCVVEFEINKATGNTNVQLLPDP